jgi:hypothetical protein
MENTIKSTTTAPTVQLDLNYYDLILTQFKIIFLDINNKTDLDVLTHVYIYGEEARDILLQKNILKSKQSVRNYICKWRKRNIIDKGNLRVNQNIPIYPTSFSRNIIFNLRK